MSVINYLVPTSEENMGKWFSKEQNTPQSSALGNSIVNSNNVTLKNIYDSHQVQLNKIMDLEIKIELGLIVLLIILVIIVIVMLVVFCKNYKVTLYNKKDAKRELAELTAVRSSKN